MTSCLERTRRSYFVEQSNLFVEHEELSCPSHGRIPCLIHTARPRCGCEREVLASAADIGAHTCRQLGVPIKNVIGLEARHQDVGGPENDEEDTGSPLHRSFSPELASE